MIAAAFRTAFRQLALLFALATSLSLAGAPAGASAHTLSSEKYMQQLDEMSALWSFYKYRYIRAGKVVSLDENGITTSEGQSYAMLRAVWANDREAFDVIWEWTKRHLQVRGDRLFAWKYRDRVLDRNSATDADSDIALALIIASRRFAESRYRAEAREILDDLWETEILHTGKNHYVTAGNWAPGERYPTIHVAYLAPYAYSEFEAVDSRHPWRELIRSSYRILHWIYFDQKLKLPPELIYIDPSTGNLFLRHPVTGKQAIFSYDAFPIFWRMAADARWHHRREGALRRRMLAFFEQEWRQRGKFLDHYTLDGAPRSGYEGLPLYATVQALAQVEDQGLAQELRRQKLDPLWARALRGRDTPYYLQNWIWFGRALELRMARSYGEFLGFLQPFDFAGFWAYFPWALFLATLALFFLARYHVLFKAPFLLLAFYLCARYLHWRWYNSLNYMEPGGPVISITLWLAEAYCFSTVALLLVQVGLKPVKEREKPVVPGFEPSVDILIPIYSESLEILEKTLIAARGIDYANKLVHVCDDSHRESVAELAARYGANYIPGPKKHAKAGNLNNALKRIQGELVVVFDTDHMPVSSFLSETVPFFSDPKLGFIQTPHHFYNEDIFQRAFGTGFSIPNEQDMFNHSIQGGRDHWGGSFFVGSGAVFRRAAMDQIGGFKLMSITEDIHTSQYLHGAGWKSVFVNKDLAVGLTAENLASYIVQRRRWMLGCLQIFFKDNPIFKRGLGIRHRLGYFASLYYFFFPVARVVFWATPLYFLLFHMHPIFAEVSVLVAYLLPYMVILPLISSVIVPGWPRMLWGGVYETAVSFPLFRSMFDLFLPKTLGFKVTPKGITSRKRVFDASSSTATLIATAITAFAIGKGLIEFIYSGIEKDAYFFNLIWASFNFVFLLVALLVAWEHPQRRENDRILKRLRFRLQAEGIELEGETLDISLGGLSFVSRKYRDMPRRVRITLLGRTEQEFEAEVVHNEKRLVGASRCGLRFVNLTDEGKEFVVLNVFGAPETWSEAHDKRPRTNAVMIAHFLNGLYRCFHAPKARRRRSQRRRSFRPLRVELPGGGEARVILRDTSAGGAGVIRFGSKPLQGERVVFRKLRGADRTAHPVHSRKVLPGVWRMGFEILQQEEVRNVEVQPGEIGIEPPADDSGDVASGLRVEQPGAGGGSVHGVVVPGPRQGQHGDRQL